jgi:Transglycosylase
MRPERWPSDDWYGVPTLPDERWARPDRAGGPGGPDRHPDPDDYYDADYDADYERDDYDRDRDYNDEDRNGDEDDWRERPAGRSSGPGSGVRGSADGGDRPGRRRARTIARRTVLAAVAVVVIFAVAFGLLLAFTPSTSDAQRRVAAGEAAHGVQPLTGPLPAKVVEALVATEDSRFYSHHGVDPLGAVRGISAPLLGRDDQGGATLDQQLVKILYTGGRRNTADQIEQTALAVKLDARYSKDDILRMYLGTVYFGHGYYGVTAAARGYFGRTPTELTWTQATMLAGLVQAPTAYDPFVHLAAAHSRQRHVIDRLVATGHLTRTEADTVTAEPLGLR